MTYRDRVVIVGASGFGREALDVLEAMQRAGAALEIHGVVDDAPAQIYLERLSARGVKYLGTLDDWLGLSEDCKFVLAIGSPQVRRMLVEKLESAGLRAFTAIHPSATIGSQPVMGEGGVICAQAAISTNVRLGRHVHVNPNATIGHDSELADFVSVNPGAVVSGEVRIAEGVLVGAGAIVLQQLTIGERAVIGAAALATKDVPNDVVVKGVPGRW